MTIITYIFIGYIIGYTAHYFIKKSLDKKKYRNTRFHMYGPAKNNGGYLLILTDDVFYNVYILDFPLTEEDIDDIDKNILY